ncbi:MAG: hypothetical protein NDJ90_01040 [Oligoflexia bacterium]|nr:hypothetical protein [Oligoflexia bacterium]
MENALAYLLNFLEDEFRGFPGVRVRVSPKTGTERSPDLVQDYDPESHDLHLRRGVYVQTGRRTHYFPVEWAEQRDYPTIRDQAEKIREELLGG